jgi:hypothetical protein
MRLSVLTALILALFCQIVRGADEPCRGYRAGPGFVEWIEDGAQRGARFANSGAEWEVSGGEGGFDSRASAWCKSCSGGLDGWILWLSAYRAPENHLEQQIAPDFVAAQFHNTPFDMRAKTGAVSISIMGLEGRARVFAAMVRAPGSKFHGDRFRDVIAVAAGKGCVSLFGILLGVDRAEMGVDQVARLDAAIRIEWYRPDYDPRALNPSPPPRHDDGLLLGDARRRAQEGR